MARHTRSEIRTLKTRHTEGLRTAKANLQSIEIIRDNIRRGTKEYAVAQQCWTAVKATLDQEQAQLDSLAAEQKEVGHYGKTPYTPTPADEAANK